MSNTENDLLEQQAIDPPENQGGGTKAAIGADAAQIEAQAIDPPENQGGSGS